MSAERDDLEDAIQTLKYAFASVKAGLERIIARDQELAFPCGPTSPYQMTDANGRYILLDALTAIVNAENAIRSS